MVLCGIGVEYGLGPRLGGLNLLKCIISSEIHVGCASSRQHFFGSVARAWQYSGAGVAAVLVQLPLEIKKASRSLCTSNTDTGALERRAWVELKVWLLTVLLESNRSCCAVFIHHIRAIGVLCSRPSPTLQHTALAFSSIDAHATAPTDHVRVLRFRCTGDSIQLSVSVRYNLHAPGAASSCRWVSLLSLVHVPATVRCALAAMVRPLGLYPGPPGA